MAPMWKSIVWFLVFEHDYRPFKADTPMENLIQIL